ncbi:MAG: DNA polymerase III subunit delta [Actinomycetota bacterium]
MTTKRSPAAVLLWGEDPYLLRDAALELLGDVRATEVDAREWQGGETADLATPSLFGDRRALLVTECRHLPDQAVKEIAAYVASPAPDARLILLARVGDRGKAPAALAKLLKDAGEVREVAVSRKELPKWLATRAASKGLDVRADACAALVEHLGESPATLDAALEQLGHAFAGRQITRDLVDQQFRGLGEQRLWDLCDRAFGKDLAGSERSLASLLEADEEPLAILGGIAARLRDLLRVKSVPDSAPAADVARAAGLRFEWQGRRYREQARRFSAEELFRLHADVAEADRVMKSGAPGDVVLPVLVAKLAGPS